MLEGKGLLLSLLLVALLGSGYAIVKATEDKEGVEAKEELTPLEMFCANFPSSPKCESLKAKEKSAEEKKAEEEKLAEEKKKKEIEENLKNIKQEIEDMKAKQAALDKVVATNASENRQCFRSADVRKAIQKRQRDLFVAKQQEKLLKARSAKNQSAQAQTEAASSQPSPESFEGLQKKLTEDKAAYFALIGPMSKESACEKLLNSLGEGKSSEKTDDADQSQDVKTQEQTKGVR